MQVNRGIMIIMPVHFTSTVLSSTSTVTLHSWSFVVLPDFLQSKGSPHMRRKREVFPTPVFPHNTTLYVLTITQSEFSDTPLATALQCVFKWHMLHTLIQTDRYMYHLMNENFSILESKIKKAFFENWSENFLTIFEIYLRYYMYSSVTVCCEVHVRNGSQANNL